MLNSSRTLGISERTLLNVWTKIHSDSFNSTRSTHLRDEWAIQSFHMSGPSASLPDFWNKSILLKKCNDIIFSKNARIQKLYLKHFEFEQQLKYITSSKNFLRKLMFWIISKIFFKVQFPQPWAFIIISLLLIFYCLHAEKDKKFNWNFVFVVIIKMFELVFTMRKWRIQWAEFLLTKRKIDLTTTTKNTSSQQKKIEACVSSCIDHHPYEKSSTTTC